MTFRLSPIVIQFGKNLLQEMFMKVYCRESSPGNQRSDSHAVLRGVNEFVSVLAALII